METLKTSIFSFIIANLVNKDVLHFFITNDLSTDFSTKEFIYTLGAELPPVCSSIQIHFLFRN